MMKLDVKAIGLTLAGCVFGAAAAYLYLTNSPIIAKLGLSGLLPGSALAAAQCTPATTSKGQNDDIFFVSCGGIY